MYVCMHVCMCVCMYICMHVCMYVCIYTYVYMYIYVYNYTHICMYIFVTYSSIDTYCMISRNKPKPKTAKQRLGKLLGLDRTGHFLRK